MRKEGGIYTEQGFVRSASQTVREAAFVFDKEVCAEINRKRKSCPSLEDALTKIPIWDYEEEALPLDMVEESIWFMLDRSRFEFQRGFFNWMDLGAIWRDVEQFAALDRATGDRMVDRFNQVLSIWIEKPSYQ